MQVTPEIPLVSFIVPAYNEERHIERTISAIQRAATDLPSHEIVVVDNGSTDRTAILAAAHGAKVLSQDGGTIGSLRNTGVRSSAGRVLVFLDADVGVTDRWAARFPSVLQLLDRQARTITGAICTIPEQASWIERVWFGPRSPSAFSHLGSGHMIMTRRFFDALGGFDETLATGEDYDISVRAKEQGGGIVADQELVAEHYGYPRTLRMFIRREMWHGSSDFASLRSVMGSKVAVLSIAFLLLHLIVVLCLVWREPVLAGAAAGAVLLLCLMSSWVKYRGQSIAIIVANSALYYVYYLGRVLSMVNAFTPRRSPRAAPGSDSAGAEMSGSPN